MAPLTSASTVTARLVETLPFAAVARTRTSCLPSATTAVALRAAPSVTAVASPSTSSSNLDSRPVAVLVVQSTVRAAPLGRVAPGVAVAPFTEAIFSWAAGPVCRSASSCG